VRLPPLYLPHLRPSLGCHTNRFIIASMGNTPHVDVAEHGLFACSYEAFVIYNFLSLCLAYVGGPGSVEVKMNGYQLEPSWLYWTCCLPPIPVNGKFVRLCKQGALQFVLIKPPLAILQIVLYTQGKFHVGRWRPNDG